MKKIMILAVFVLFLGCEKTEIEPDREQEQDSLVMTDFIICKL